MAAEGAAASRRGPRSVPLVASSRVRLDERLWRRICKLGDSGKLYSVGIRADEVRLVWRSQEGSLESNGPGGAKGRASPPKTRPERAQNAADRPQRPPNSAQRRSARRAKAHVPKHLRESQPEKAAPSLNPAAPAFEMPKHVESDVQMDISAPPSPRREQATQLQEASETLAMRQQQRHAAQLPASGQRRVEPTRRLRRKSGRSKRGGREGPGLQPLTGSESEAEDL